MVYDLQWQMGCCLCCGGPLEPSREALRRDRVGSRALNFIEGDAIQHKSEWNLDGSTDPTLVSVKEDLHLFHTTNVASAMQELLFARLKDVWLESNAPLCKKVYFQPSNAAFARTLRKDFSERTMVDPGMYVIGKRRQNRHSTDEYGDTKTPYKAVTWQAPDELKEFRVLTDLIRECIGNVGGNLIEKPNLDMVAVGCKMCNNIMTVQATSAHFLVRKTKWTTPLVKDNSILVCGMSSAKVLDGKTKYDPNDDTRSGILSKFSYEACVAYYIHRCLPKKPRAADMIRETNVRMVVIYFAWIVLEICCLDYERKLGLQGGDVKRTKPAYRYRGCCELYLGYLYWVLLQNDNPHNTPDGARQRRSSMPFYQFQRYFFTEVLDTLALAVPDLAWACEVMDLVSGQRLDYKKEPDEIIGILCEGIVDFYKKYLKPHFSRHLANLQPDPTLGIDDPLHLAQRLVWEMLITVNDFNLVIHLLERGTIGDLDTFIDCTGVGSVLRCWQRNLALGACKHTVQLLDDFVDALVRVEYLNIAKAMSPDPELPSVTLRTAELVFQMCGALELVTEPDTEEELQLLRVAPKCSRIKAVPRLSQVGAFTDEKQAG